MIPSPALEAQIVAAAEKHLIAPSLLRAIVQHESNFNPNAVGDGGQARGLCQMHPEAAADVGADWSLFFDPELALDAGAAYLAKLIGDFEYAWMAVAAYNGGAGTIHRGPTARFWWQAMTYARDVYALIKP